MGETEYLLKILGDFVDTKIDLDSYIFQCENTESCTNIISNIKLNHKLLTQKDLDNILKYISDKINECNNLISQADATPKEINATKELEDLFDIFKKLIDIQNSNDVIFQFEQDLKNIIENNNLCN
jgi:hypothetical protein